MHPRLPHATALPFNRRLRHPAPALARRPFVGDMTDEYSGENPLGEEAAVLTL